MILRRELSMTSMGRRGLRDRYPLLMPVDLVQVLELLSFRPEISQEDHFGSIPGVQTTFLQNSLGFQARLVAPVGEEVA